MEIDWVQHGHRGRKGWVEDEEGLGGQDRNERLVIVPGKNPKFQLFQRSNARLVNPVLQPVMHLLDSKIPGLSGLWCPLVSSLPL